jgi:hypothetical protein
MMVPASVEQMALQWDKRLVAEMDVDPAAAMDATTENQTAVEWVAKLVKPRGCLGA